MALVASVAAVPRELDLANPVGRSAGSLLPLTKWAETLVELGESSLFSCASLAFAEAVPLLIACL